MARRIYSEDLVLNLIINGKDMPAQNKLALNELYKLDRATRELELQLAKNERAQKRLSKSSATYAQDLKKLENEHKKLTRAINQNHAQMNQLRKDIGLTGLTINQLNSYLKVLKIQLNNATDPRTMARLRKEIILTENRIKHLVTGASRLSIAFERMGTIANKFGTITSWLAIIGYAFGRAVGGTVSNLRNLDKQFSNVMKSTNLTRQEMWALKKQFDQLNVDEAMRTPTKTTDLMEIARIAGRLGVRGVKDVADFTMAVDKLYVALGEDLQGTIEDVAEKIGKLVNTFRLTDELPLGEAMLRAGSLINELSKSSAAGAETILNYTSRLGGVGSMAQFSMDQLAGLGAALDAVGVPAERGSTALAKLIMGMGNHAEEFARMLGMTTEEYTEMMKTNINGAMLSLAEASARGNESIMDVVAGMDQMDVTGVRVMEVYGKLVQNMDLVIEQQTIASKAFASSASVMNEFYIMSKDFDSLMAIQGKRLKTLADSYSKSVAPSVYKLYKWFTDLAFSIKNVVLWIGKHINLLGTLVSIWTAFKSAAIVRRIASITTAFIVWSKELVINTQMALLNNAAINKMYIAYTQAGRGIKGVAAAMKAMTATMIKNPFTAIVTVISLVVGALFLFRKRADEVNAAVAEMNAEVKAQDTAMKFLFDTIKRTNEGTKQRADLINRANILYGEYLPNLISERDTAEQVGDAYNYASAELAKKIRLEATQTKLADLTESKEKEISEGIDKIFKNIKDPVQRGMLKANFRIVLDELEDWSKDVGDITGDVLDKVNEVIRKYDIGDGFLISGATGGTYRALKKVYENRAELEKMKRKFMGEYEGGEKAYQKAAQNAGIGWEPMISESEYNQTIKEAENARDQMILLKKNEALELKKNDEWLKKEELKAEEEFTRKLIEITKLRWTSIKEIKNEKTGGFDYEQKELPGMEAALLPYQTQLAENLLAQRGEGKAGPKTSAPKEKEIKLIDVAKITASAKKDEQERELAEEQVRYENALQSYKLTEDEKTAYLKKSTEERRKIDENRMEAQKAEEQLHKTNLNEIHLKYLDQQLADDTLTYTQKIVLLEAELKQELITQEEYNQRKREITNDFENDMLVYKRRYGILVEDTLQEEIAMYQKSEFYALLTEEEKQKGIEAIRKKYDDKRERTFKSNIEKEFDAIKAGFNDLQMEALAQGEAMIGVWQMVGQGMGDAFAQLFDRSQKGFSALAKNLVLTAIDLAATMARAMYPTILAKQIMKNAAIPGGLAIALTNTATSIALIEAAIGTAKGLVSALWKTEKKSEETTTTTQYKKGNYPVDQLKNYIAARQFDGGNYAVTGADDGKTYNAQYVGRVTTGIYRRPSLGLFAEKPEMVIDYPTLRRIQFNNPRIIEAILAYRTQNQDRKTKGTEQFAKGNYLPATNFEGGDPEMKELLRQNIELQKKLLSWKPKVYTELIKRDLDTLESIERNRGL